MNICAKSLGLAGGIFWGLSLFLITWIHLFTGYGSLWLELMTNIYPGYTPTMLGSVIGLIWGFIDGFLCLFILGWLYNKIAKV